MHVSLGIRSKGRPGSRQPTTHCACAASASRFLRMYIPPPLLSTIPIEIPNLPLQAVEMAVKRTIQSLSRKVRSRASCLWTGHKVSIGMKRSRQNSTHCACAPSASGWPDSQKARSSPGNGSASRWGAHRQQDTAKRHQGRHTDSASVIDRILASDGFVPVPP